MSDPPAPSPANNASYGSPGIETTNTGTVYRVLEDGTKVIAPSRRPDGTLRKPIRVKAGYTPLEENVYKGPAVQRAFHDALASNRIPGLSEPAPPPKNAREALRSAAKPVNSGYPPGYVPDVPAPKPTTKVLAKAKAKPAKAPPEPSQAVPPATQQTEGATEVAKTAPPEKKVRNLRKKLAEITALEEKLRRDGADNLLAEERQKISRKSDVEAEIKELEAEFTHLRVQ